MSDLGESLSHPLILPATQAHVLPCRRDYDRRLSEGYSTSGSSSMSPRGPYDSSDNTARRARATYAWDYQRKHSGPRTARSASSTYHRHGTFTSSAGAGGAATASERVAFDQLQARVARREAAAAARAADAGRAERQQAWDDEAAASSSAGTVLRFGQVMLMLAGTFWIASMIGGAKIERKVKNDELESWAYRETLVLRKREKRQLQA